MKNKVIGKVINIKSIIQIESSNKNQKVSIQYEPIKEDNLKNFYDFLNIDDRKNLLKILSLPRKSSKYLWDERIDHEQFYKNIIKINNWDIKRHEIFLESLFNKEPKYKISGVHQFFLILYNYIYFIFLNFFFKFHKKK